MTAALDFLGAVLGIALCVWVWIGRGTVDRNEAITIIKAALKRRTGKPWGVTGGSGTAWGWITIDALPKLRTWRYRLKAGEFVDLPRNYEEYDSGQPGGLMGPSDRAELAKALGLEKPVHDQGQSIPAGSDYYQEYVDRAEGRTPTVIGQAYWD